MFKKPFNRIIGEDRACKYCNETFHTKKPIWVCDTCRNRLANQKTKELKDMGMQRWIPKALYPVPDSERKTKFDRLQAKLRKMDLREDWKQYLSERLDEVMQDELLMAWIYDRRDEESMKAKKVKKYGIDVNKVPSTKNMDWDKI